MKVSKHQVIQKNSSKSKSKKNDFPISQSQDRSHNEIELTGTKLNNLKICQKDHSNFNDPIMPNKFNRKQGSTDRSFFY